MEPNLAGSIYVRSSIKLLHLVPFDQQTWPPRLILFSDWLMLKKSSPLKQLDQLEPNLAGRIYVRSKPGIDGPWVCPFQNCVRQPHPPFKMAAVFSSPCQRQCELLPSLGVRYPLTFHILIISSETQGSRCRSPMSQFAFFFLDWRLKSAAGDFFLAPRFPCVNL